MAGTVVFMWLSMQKYEKRDDGANILNANESAAEQSVMHLHFHIIPRKNGDGLKVFPSGDAGELDMAKVAEKLKLN